MNWIESIKDSVETSVTLKLFSSQKTAAYTHIFKSEYKLFSISRCETLENFDSSRLSHTPYPNRPRGQKDLDSVAYHRKEIRNYGHTTPIWIASKEGNLILLDGAHRIIATYLENKKTVPAYIVKV